MNITREHLDITERVNFGALHNKSILMTGATGFVGRWLQEGLVCATHQGVKYQVTALDHEGYCHWTNYRHIAHYDYIIHLAPTFNDRLLSQIIECKPEAVFFASSGAVYHKELNDYGREKLKAEASILLSGLNFRIARLFTFCGPWLRPGNFAVGNFVQNAVDGVPIKVYGKGDTIRTYMYGADLAVWLWKMILSDDTNLIYNIGSEQQISILQLAAKVCKIVNPVTYIDVMNNDFYERAPVYVPDTKRTRKELGVEETYDLDYQITRYAEWMHDQTK